MKLKTRMVVLSFLLVFASQTYTAYSQTNDLYSKGAGHEFDESSLINKSEVIYSASTKAMMRRAVADTKDASIATGENKPVGIQARLGGGLTDTSAKDVSREQQSISGRQGTLPLTHVAAPAAPLRLQGSPAITATLVDSFPDPDGDGKAMPGDELTYSATISNSGTGSAYSVTFVDMTDPNTTFSPGSVSTVPSSYYSQHTYSYGNLHVPLGTLSPGASVTIIFKMIVNYSLPSSVTQISSQGYVSGNNFGMLYTNDPSTGAPNDPTVTAILPPPTYTINNASVAEPALGSVNMLFTVTLSHAYGSTVSVNFSTADGTATATDGDYTPTSGSLNFAPGEMVQTISVPVLANGDTWDENFTVTLSNPINSVLGANPTATGTITEASPPGRVLISELRTSGPGGAGDDFIELYNNQDVPQNISGWAVFKSGASCSSTPVTIATIPNNTTIPARGHYLLVGSAYSLHAYAGGNQILTSNIENDRNVALFNTSNPLNLSTTTREDAVGFGNNTGNNCDLLREGTNLAAALGSITQHSFARNLITGLPKETNDNAADFLIVATTGAAVGNTPAPVLGAPGPENLTSPIQRNGQIKAGLVDPMVSVNSSPNRVRNANSYTDTLSGTGTYPLGTLSIRRKFTNTTGSNVTGLRYRIVDFSTLNNPITPTAQADLRAISSPDITVTVTGGGSVPVKGTTLEMPPAQPNGGGLNSSLASGTITLGTPLAPGQSINVQFLLGVKRNGNLNFFINVEAGPSNRNLPPTVSITSPSNNATFTRPVNLDVEASAADSDGNIIRVDFYAGSKLIGTSTAPPYKITWVNARPGTHVLTAVATDNSGVSTTSASVNVTVDKSPVECPDPQQQQCPEPSSRLITADVVAFDQVFFYNRLGALNPAGMIYALRQDVVPIDASQGLVPGNVQLRQGKRPRPLVLRMNVGDRLQINFQNLLAPNRADDNQPATRTASVHVVGLQPAQSILDDGSNIGTNASSLVSPGSTATYTLYAEREGTHLFYSTAATTGGEGDGGSLAMGLFGSVNVEPKGAEWYRSQVTREEMEFATTGRTPDNHPIINYDAVYPTGHPRAGQPVLRILQGEEIVHGDLNAIITGANKGCFTTTGECPPPGVDPADGWYRSNPAEPNRNQPFREFTAVYHDEIKAVQAFPQFFEDPILSHTLHSVRDAFAINYGTGGIGSEILANRLGVGPMRDCTECLYEEFFLSAWTVGDPAQIVDVPANAQDANGNVITGPKATKVFFPEDPSNVHHAYLNDHTKFRVTHAGPKEHHIHHLHAHQWFHTPDSDNSTTLDSQAFGPGFSFTTEILHGGAGNRGKTPGDSIFHCHFYPHFAMGMWELWRVHDVFEEGTPLDNEGKPIPGTRALPDGEISRGTPIPALVPLPTLPMAPMPQAQVSIVNGQIQITGTGNPGFPFFVPAKAGHRPPHPPLDTIDDGGLPRHIITGGEAVHHKEQLPQFDKNKARLDFDKSLVEAEAQEIPEPGTPTENAAMNFHAQRTHPTFTPNGLAAAFITNGLPRKPGAPFSDPCVDDAGNPAGVPRLFKSANIQLDVKFNKAGWHFPQQRISALWDDVAAFRDGSRPPEPLFFRANTNDCITFQFTNLVPRVYVQDDYQVRTPTDIMGQHIHLVKFDVLASDGAGNGWNYEDGSFAPEEVIERIHAINARGGLLPFNGGSRFTLTPEPHPFFGTPGAQTTISRWFADDVRNRAGDDRTLRTAFTHDHFGPSTHQQVGLYAGLVIEPLGSTWRHSETGQVFGNRHDGGPTSWRADILTTNPADSYREFLLEFADFQHAYKAGGGIDANGQPVADPANVINPPGKKEVGLPFLLQPPERCPVENGHEASAPFLPCPEAISADDVGTMVVNYRNEPIPHRIVDNPDASFPQQVAGLAGDLSHVYRSDIARVFTPMNTQPGFYPPLTGGVSSKDPFTPLLRAYEDDKVQIRILVGAHEEGHNFGVHGIKWLFEPAEPNSGYRNNQMMGISEHFEFVIPPLPKSSIGSFADYLYQPGVAVDDQWNGLWGIMRAYNNTQPDLQTLPNNPDGHGPVISNVGDFDGVCPKTAPVRNFNVTAVTAQNALPGGTLVYNQRTNLGGKLHDPTAILYVRSSDLDANGQLLPGTPVEPLILRANAGDCINLSLTNRLPSTAFDLDGFNTLPMIVNHFNANQIKPSSDVGLHPQLVFYDVTRSDGTNVGFNKVQTAAPGHSISYQWYAGDMVVQTNGAGASIPIEFGATNLQSSDPIKHSNKGAIGSLIIEPQGATWIEDANSRAQATVNYSGGSFREFVLLHQTDLNLRFGERYDEQGNHKAVPNLAEAEDPEDSGQKAFNYRTEPLWKRLNFEPNTPLEQTRDLIFTNVLTNAQVGGDPVTPVFTATVGTPTRFRLLMPGGHARNSVFNLHGHIWEELPYTNDSTRLGHNLFSEWKGSQFGIGAGSHFDVLLKNGAGGRFLIRGDYLYRNQTSFLFDGGMWGIFRVQ